MKILVIDDKAVQQAAAKETIIGHDLTVVGSWDEAVELLKVRYDERVIGAKLMSDGFPATGNKLKGEAWKKWSDAYWKAKEAGKIPYWDVVLCDLLMPASSECMGDKGMEFVGQEMPIGLVLALLAAKNGARYVAVVTDANHHHHPASAMLDRLGEAYWNDDQKPNFVINGARAMFVHTPFMPDFEKDAQCYNCLGGTACEWCRTSLIDGKCPRLHEGQDHAKPCSVCSGNGKYDKPVHERKHWGKVLARLTGQEVAKDEINPRQTSNTVP